MAKILTDIEMAEIIDKIVNDADNPVIVDQDVYFRFLNDLAELITDYCGGDHGTPSYDASDKLGNTVAFHINDSVPSDGGIYKDYDQDVTWKDGEEKGWRREMKKKTKKEIIIWASGEFLTEYLPEDYDKMDTPQLLSYVEDHTCRDCEDNDAKDIWQKINDLADSFEQFMDK